MSTVDGYIAGCREKINFLFKRKMQVQAQGVDAQALERINTSLYFVYKKLEVYEYEAYKQTHSPYNCERTLFSDL